MTIKYAFKVMMLSTTLETVTKLVFKFLLSEKSLIYRANYDNNI